MSIRISKRKDKLWWSHLNTLRLGMLNPKFNLVTQIFTTLFRRLYIEFNFLALLCKYFYTVSLLKLILIYISNLYRFSVQK